MNLDQCFGEQDSCRNDKVFPFYLEGVQLERKNGTIPQAWGPVEV